MSDDIYQKVVERLIEIGVSSPRLEARLLIEDAFKNKKTDIFSVVLNEKEQKKLEENLKKRLMHMPLDKILQKKDFYKETFVTSEDVLSPRPDTEILVEESIQTAKTHGLKSVLELGVGSGCVLLSILKEITDIQGVGVDCSRKALFIARQNLENLKLQKRCQLMEADWFKDDFLKLFSQKFDMVVSNPPYIPTADISELEPEVKNFDPMMALDGGKDGLDSYKRIAFLLPNLLKKGGYALFEIGQGQSKQVCSIFEEQNFKLDRIVPDLAGIERVLVFQKL